MDIALSEPMSREEFFAWAERQELPYEFDGYAPVPMTGGNAGHNRLICNLIVLLHNALDGTEWEHIGPEAGIATVGNTVRYPDIVITGTPFDNHVRLIPEPVAVFEVVSPTSGRMDRNVKLREYAAVPSIRHYVIVDSDFIGVTVFTRSGGGKPFEAGSPPEDDAVKLPAVGIELSVAAIYRGVLAPSGNAGA